MIWKSRFLAALIASGIAGWAATASAASPFAVIPPDEVLQASPAYHYANMSNDEAFAELGRRGVRFQRTSATPGVRAPIRLSGPLHGVDIHSSLPAEERADSLFEVLDARLALALDDFSALLAEHDIVELVHYTMYRPNVAKPDPNVEPTADDKGSLHAKSGVHGYRHASKGKDGAAEKAPETNDAASPGAAAEPDKAKKAKPKGKTKGKAKPHMKPSKPAIQPKAKGKPSKAHADKPHDPAGKTAEKPAEPVAPKAPSDKVIDPPAAKGAPIDSHESPAAKPEEKPVEKPKHHDKAHADKSKAGKAHVKRAKSHDKHDKTHPAKDHKSHADKNAKGHTRASVQEQAPELPSHIRHAVVDDVHEVDADEHTPERKVSWAPPGTRHPAGLAIDVGGLRKSDGHWLTVADHFGGHIGAQTCGAGAKPPASAEGRELWSIVCDSNARGLFTYVLTPNYNAAHSDHFHMEIKAGSKIVLFQ